MEKRNSSRQVIINLSVDQNHNKVLRSREKTQKQHDEKIQNDWQLISSAKPKTNAEKKHPLLFAMSYLSRFGRIEKN